jgi:soluble lytic murein transglycosylase
MWGRIGHMAAVKLMPEANEWYRRGGSLVGVGAGTFRGDEVLEWQVRSALRAGTGSSNGPDWRTVRSAIERMAPELQREPAWIYWRARTLVAEARVREANELLRRIAGKFTYYGKLAAEALGQPIVIPPRAAPSAAAEVAAFGDNAGLARALKFFDLGLRQEGNLEWNWQTRGMTDRQLLALAEFARSRDVTERMISTSDRTREEFDFTQRFPVPYRDSLARNALAAGVDEAWVYALIRQESRFVVDARSPVGAVGLMQLMPATARYTARRAGAVDFAPERLADLDTNLRIGTTYLRLVLDDLDGSPVLASAAYNAGPNRPRAWRASLARPVEGAIFIETIPIAETRDYVQKVMSNSVYYAALLNNTPPSLLARLGVITPKPATATDIP